MIVHVYERAQEATLLDEVIIAIDSEETAKALEPFHIKTVMTSPDHQSGTDRVSEVIQDMDVNIVVNIQGDEPGMDFRLIDQMIQKFKEKNIFMVTAASTDLSLKDELDPNTVKVLLDHNNIALAFRREPRPYEMGGYYRHIGIYAFRKQALLTFSKLPQTTNEKEQKLEQLRALDHGLPIHVMITDYRGRSIDTEDDLKIFLEKNG